MSLSAHKEISQKKEKKLAFSEQITTMDSVPVPFGTQHIGASRRNYLPVRYSGQVCPLAKKKKPSNSQCAFEM